jgi:hypothetical protein
LLESESSDHDQDDRFIINVEVLSPLERISRSSNSLLAFSSSLKWEEHLESRIKQSLFDKLSVSAAAFVETKNAELGDVVFDSKPYIMAWGNDKYKLRALNNRQDLVNEFSGERYNLNELIT